MPWLMMPEEPSVVCSTQEERRSLFCVMFGFLRVLQNSQPASQECKRAPVVVVISLDRGMGREFAYAQRREISESVVRCEVSLEDNPRPVINTPERCAFGVGVQSSG